MSADPSEPYRIIDPARARELVELFDALPRLPLGDIAPPAKSYGVYGLFPASSCQHANTYLRELAQRSLPVYLGKADRDTLAMRLAAHLESVSRARNLDVERFEAVFLRLPREDGNCRAAEQLLIEAYGPAPWLGSGFGNKALGGPRSHHQTGQMISPWDTVHPGRGRGEDSAPQSRRRNPEIILVDWQAKIRRMRRVAKTPGPVLIGG